MVRDEQKGSRNFGWFAHSSRGHRTCGKAGGEGDRRLTARHELGRRRRAHCGRGFPRHKTVWWITSRRRRGQDVNVDVVLLQVVTLALVH